jgi:octanoyl-[GcvH]:protein N-octanoyltransferase
MDTAVSRAILERVAAGLDPETLRIHRPGPAVAFGPRDRLAPRFPRAVGVAQEHGFGSILRLAGGRAAVFHQDTIAFSWVMPDPEPRSRITARFEEVSALMASAFRRLGVDARVGEVPGEYCPGAHSVNARGRTKLMGVGQRLVQHAAHVGGVVVVCGSDRIRDVLLPVYEALGLAWDPQTVGSLADEDSSITWDAVAEAILGRFAERYDLEEERLPDEAIGRAHELVPDHSVA